LLTRICLNATFIILWPTVFLTNPLTNFEIEIGRLWAIRFSQLKNCSQNVCLR
jgi:hypothetical protein